MKKLTLVFICVFIVATTFSQRAYQCYPTHWWTGMQWNKVQLMVHSKGIGEKIPMIKMSASGMKLAPGVQLMKINRVENPNYVFLDLQIDETAKPGFISFPFPADNKLKFELKQRPAGNGITFAQGVTSKDFIYLIMPDRFSNGDPSNDRVAGMLDQSLSRDSVYDRHGGDFTGIKNHLDYLQSLGVTTLWLNPVIINDMPYRTEHGYAFTDHYKVDPRFGGDEGYKELITVMHKRNMKMIQDAVYNHVGNKHFTVTDPPMKDWLHQWPSYTNTNYKDQAVFDPHGSAAEKKIMTDGWFTQEMPDLNQENPYVANFLIQHAIWTVEEYGIDGWRIDTYSYNDLDFMNRCNSALEKDFPKITLFGETWVHGVVNQSYFTENNYNLPFKSNLQATTDFQALWGITDALTKDFGWTDGVNRLYTTLAQDFVYKDPMREVIFLDNHDLTRFFTIVGEDVTKYKSALSWLLTCRGIPQIYYGAELGMSGATSPNDGHVRQPFPGGWPADADNKFTIAGRSAEEEGIWRHVTKLANFRKVSSAITTGKMMQYLPVDGLYVYFRYDSTQSVMIAMNASTREKTVDAKKYTERTGGYSGMKDVQSAAVSPLGEIILKPYETVVLELSK